MSTDHNPCYEEPDSSHRLGSRIFDQGTGNLTQNSYVQQELTSWATLQVGDLDSVLLTFYTQVNLAIHSILEAAPWTAKLTQTAHRFDGPGM